METVDGFTDTYEFSKAHVDVKDDSLHSFALKTIADVEDFQKTVEGGLDYLDGNESYAAKYYLGQLFANNIVSFNHLDGMEGFLDDVWAKIKQFFKWLASKFKGNDSIKTLTKEEATKTKMNTLPSNVTLHKDGIERLTTALKKIETDLKNLKPKLVPKHAKLVEDVTKLKAQHPECYHEVEYSSPEEFEKLYDNVVERAEHLTEKATTLKTAQEVSAFLNSDAKMFWNLLIELYNKRIRCKGILMLNGFQESVYATLVQRQAEKCKNEKEIPTIAKNLMDVVSFNIPCAYLSNISTNLHILYSLEKRFFIYN